MVFPNEEGQNCKILQVETGYYHAIVYKQCNEEKRLYAWGKNVNESFPGSYFPIRLNISILNSTIVRITAGDSNTLMLVENGQIIVCDGTFLDCKFKSLGASVANVSCGQDHCVASTNDNRIFAFGNNRLFVLGIDNVTVQLFDEWKSSILFDNEIKQLENPTILQVLATNDNTYIYVREIAMDKIAIVLAVVGGVIVFVVLAVIVAACTIWRIRVARSKMNIKQLDSALLKKLTEESNHETIPIDNTFFEIKFEQLQELEGEFIYLELIA